ARILRAIADRRRYSGRRLAADVAEAADAIMDALKARHPGAVLTPVGSLRRGLETCGDLDILASAAPPAIIDAFVALPQVERVLGRGETKSSVLLNSGLQADLRLVTPAQQGAALQYFTGSKAHNIALRDRAMDRGWRLNEYGLFDVESGRAIAGETEAGIYEALGLQWIPPELRECRGEIEAAEAGTLPTLVTLEDLRGDLHSHTPVTDGRDALPT